MDIFGVDTKDLKRYRKHLSHILDDGQPIRTENLQTFDKLTRSTSAIN